MYVCMYAGSIRQCYPTLSDSRVSHLAVIRPYSSLFSFFPFFLNFPRQMFLVCVSMLRIEVRFFFFLFFFLVLFKFSKAEVSRLRIDRIFEVRFRLIFLNFPYTFLISKLSSIFLDVRHFRASIFSKIDVHYFTFYSSRSYIRFSLIFSKFSEAKVSHLCIVYSRFDFFF